ncbi:MAG: chemotaxis protein CheX, partial [Spirochaetaceae bacterium]|nr:chemotaxis protein CheX [Spirochaetaceae bacterium]
LQSPIRRGEINLKSTATPVLGVAAFVGLAGDVEGRVLFDMSRITALKIASTMNGEQMIHIDEMVKSTISELANMIVGSAVTRLQETGFNFDLTPPAIIVGDNMEITSQRMEALVVPMVTPQGVVEINVAVRERL